MQREVDRDRVRPAAGRGRRAGGWRSWRPSWRRSRRRARCARPSRRRRRSAADAGGSPRRAAASRRRPGVGGGGGRHRRRLEPGASWTGSARRNVVTESAKHPGPHTPSASRHRAQRVDLGQTDALSPVTLVTGVTQPASVHSRHTPPHLTAKVVLHAQGSLRRPPQRPRAAGQRRAGREPAAGRPAAGGARGALGAARGRRPPAVGATAARRSLQSSTEARSDAPRPSAGRPPAARRCWSRARDSRRFDLLGVTWRRTGPGSGADRRWSAPTATTAGPAGPALDPPRPRPAAEGREARPGTEPLWVGAVRRLPGARRRPHAARCPGACGSTSSTPAARRPTPPAGAGGRCRARPAAAAAAGHLHPRPVGRGRADPRAARPATTPRSRPASCTTPPAPTTTPRPQVPKILRGDLRLPRQGQRLVRRRLQLPRRPVRPDSGRAATAAWTARCVGAHTGGFNVNTFAVSAIGNFDKVAAPPVMVDAIARVMAWKLALNFREPERHDDADVPRRRDVALPRRGAGHLQQHLRAPRRGQDLVPWHQPLRPARPPSGR